MCNQNKAYPFTIVKYMLCAKKGPALKTWVKRKEHARVREAGEGGGLDVVFDKSDSAN